MTILDFIIPALIVGVLIVRPRWWLLTALVVSYACLVLWAAFGGGNNIAIHGALSVAFQLVLFVAIAGTIVVAVRKRLQSRRQAGSISA